MKVKSDVARPGQEAGLVPSCSLPELQELARLAIDALSVTI